jgi:peptidoglycan L-alanyl-D-glutamate endopeptidase CwlK
MPKFSSQSINRLHTCHPDLQVLFYEVIKTIDCTILEGYRNEIDQEKAFNAGNSKLHYPNGKHNKSPSFAVDVSPYPVDWAKINRFYWFAGIVMGLAIKLKEEGKITHDIRYGGDWNRDYKIGDQSFNDLVHFEIVV